MQEATSIPAPTFEEGHVEADRFRIRHVSAGAGAPLVHLHGGGGLELTPAHDLLARGRRVIAFEMPGFGDSPENTRHRTMPDLARTMLEAVSALGVERFDLLGTSFGGKTALWVAILAPERVGAVVLESPAAIRPEGHPPPQEQRATTGPLVARLMAPNRDAALEEAMQGLAVPVLVVFGTRDRVIPPEMGRVYKALLPSCQLLFVYDAGHAVSTDRPEAFTEAALDFLERHEQYVVSRRGSVIFP